MNFKSFKSLFFKNIGIRQTIFKNTIWLTVAEGSSRLLDAALIIYMTRILGPTEFGKFAFVLAFVSVFVMLSDFGLATVTTREFSQDKNAEKEYSTVLSLKIILSAIALVLMLIGSFFITSDLVVRKVIWILAIFSLMDNFFFIIYSFLRARQQMEYEAGIKIFQTLITIVIGFFILFKFPSILNVSYGYLIANFIALSAILLFIHFRVFNLRLGFNKVVLQKFFSFSWPLGVAAIFGAIFINIDSVIMGHLGKITEVGWYNVAKVIVGFAVIPATLITMSFYPALSKLFKESKEKLQRVWNYYMESMIILAIPIMFGGFILSSQIIDFIYGPSYRPAILAFQILIFSAGIGLLYGPYLTMLVVSNQQKKYLWINIIAAITNVILNLVLIPKYSLYGAAAATIATYLVILFGGIIFSSGTVSISFFNLRLLKITVMAIASSLIMSVIISQLLTYNLNTIVMVVLGIIVYFLALFFAYNLFFKLNLLSKTHE
jgi:O-antigen/teichoic acid export membrane protein